VIGPELTRESFLASPVGQAAEVSVKNEPWCSWHFVAHDENEPFGVTLYFHGERLMQVTLCASHERFGIPWTCYSKDLIESHVKFHAQWLRERCGVVRPRSSWGTIWSGFDDRAGFAHISVCYDHEHGPGWISDSIGDLGSEEHQRRIYRWRAMKMLKEERLGRAALIFVALAATLILLLLILS